MEITVTKRLSPTNFHTNGLAIVLPALLGKIFGFRRVLQPTRKRSIWSSGKVLMRWWIILNQAFTIITQIGLETHRTLFTIRLHQTIISRRQLTKNLLLFCICCAALWVMKISLKFCRHISKLFTMEMW